MIKENIYINILFYSLHDNIKAEPYNDEKSLENVQYSPYGLSENVHSMPYKSMDDVFDLNKILISLNK